MNSDQRANASWWSANPMSYDWERRIDAPEGTPDFFRQSDARALEAHRPFGHPDHPREPAYARLIDWNGVKERRVLEIGCGLGLHASLFASAGARVTTTDLTATATRLARRRFLQQSLPVSLAQSDGEGLPFRDATFDRVWSWGVIHHSARTETIAREILRVLKPGGLFQGMVYHRRSVRYWLIGGVQHGLLRGKLLRMTLDEVNQTFTDGAIARHYTRTEIARLLRGFTQVRCRILQEAGSDAIPKISPILHRLAPHLTERVDAWANRHFGWFLFFEAEKPAR